MGKRILAMCLSILSLLSLGACSFSRSDPYLQPSGINWGMKPEAFMEQMGIQEDNIAQCNEATRTKAYVFTDVEIFGEQAAKLICNFYDTTYTEDYPDTENDHWDYGLVEMRVYYSDNADKGKVLREMKKSFGETLPEIYYYTYGVISEDYSSLVEKRIEESDTVKLWGGPKLSEAIPEQMSLEYRDLWKLYNPGLNDENWVQFQENERLVTAYWVDSDNDEEYNVQIDAYNLAVYNEIKGYLED